MVRSSWVLANGRCFRVGQAPVVILCCLVGLGSV